MNSSPSSLSLLPSMPFVPWCNSSYNNNNGNQMIQQFVPSPTFADCMQKFFIKFILGNISVCYGCWNRYSKSPELPDDICLQTEEWRQFTPAGSLLSQTRWSNTYYHLHVNCAHLKWPTFNLLTQVIVEENIQAHLLDSHKEIILKKMGKMLLIKTLLLTCL